MSNSTFLLFGIAFAIAAITSLLVTPLVRKLAQHVGMVDVTDERRMHVEPKPRIGGIAVSLGSRSPCLRRSASRCRRRRCSTTSPTSTSFSGCCSAAR